jgi:hypothetical protein
MNVLSQNLSFAVEFSTNREEPIRVRFNSVESTPEGGEMSCSDLLQLTLKQKIGIICLKKEIMLCHNLFQIR